MGDILLKVEVALVCARNFFCCGILVTKINRRAGDCQPAYAAKGFQSRCLFYSSTRNYAGVKCSSCISALIGVYMLASSSKQVDECIC